MSPQIEALRKNPRIVIATPGRLIDHMSQWNFLPENVTMLVLDEADRMLDMGFQPQITKILRFLPKDRQTMLFSATIPKEIMQIAATYMKLPVSVEIAPSGTTVELVTQELFIVKKEAKLRLLSKLLAQYHGSVLLFSRTKHNARKITVSIRHMGYSAAEIHSNRSLGQRREALDGFKKAAAKDELDFRFPVQDIYKFTEEDDDRRIVAGRVESGSIKAGEEVVFLPSKKRSRISSIEVFSAGRPPKAFAGQSTGFCLETSAMRPKASWRMRVAVDFFPRSMR